jgi:hypothetical protein
VELPAVRHQDVEALLRLIVRRVTRTLSRRTERMERDLDTAVERRPAGSGAALSRRLAAAQTVEV